MQPTQRALQVGEQGSARPRPVRARLSFEQGLLRRDCAREAWTLWLEGGLLGPAEVVGLPDDAREGSATLDLAGASLVPTTPVSQSALLVTPLTPPPGAPFPWPLIRTQVPDGPVDCVAIGDPDLAPLALGANHLTASEAGWTVAPSLPVDDSWHGAAVVTREGGELVGLLLVDEDEARVAFLRR